VDPVVSLVTDVGFPIAVLIVLWKYHIKVLKEKDGELESSWKKCDEIRDQHLADLRAATADAASAANHQSQMASGYGELLGKHEILLAEVRRELAGYRCPSCEEGKKGEKGV